MIIVCMILLLIRLNLSQLIKVYFQCLSLIHQPRPDLQVLAQWNRSELTFIDLSVKPSFQLI